jgi:hypothetical protein
MAVTASPAESPDDDEKNRLLERWENELADFSNALIGHSLNDWLSRDEVILKI